MLLQAAGALILFLVGVETKWTADSLHEVQLDIKAINAQLSAVNAIAAVTASGLTIEIRDREALSQALLKEIEVSEERAQERESRLIQRVNGIQELISHSLPRK